MKVSGVTAFVDPDTMEPTLGISISFTVEEIERMERSTLYSTIASKVADSLEDKMMQFK